MRHHGMLWLAIASAGFMLSCGESDAGSSSTPSGLDPATTAPSDATAPSNGAWTDGEPLPPPLPSNDPGMREIDWTGITDDAQKLCSGSWEYDAACCGTSWKYKSCKHTPNPLTTLQRVESIPATPGSCTAAARVGECWSGCMPGYTWYSGCDPYTGECYGSYCQNSSGHTTSPWICNWSVSCGYGTTCQARAQLWKDTPEKIVNNVVTEGFPKVSLDFYSAIVPRVVSESAQLTWTAAASYTNWNVPAFEPSHDKSCTIALDNAPSTILVGRHSSCVIGGSNLDKTVAPLAVGACPTSYPAEDLRSPSECAQPMLYSTPGLTKAGIMAGATPSSLNPKPVNDSLGRYPLSCTTCEDKLFVATGNQGADAQNKYTCLQNRLDEAYATPNLLPNSSFEADTNADAIPDGYAVNNNSSAAEPATASLQAGGAQHGSKFYRLSWTIANTTTKGIWASATGIHGTGGIQGGGWRTGVWYTASWYAKASGTNVGRTMHLGWNSGPQQSAPLTNPALSTIWQRYAYRFKWDPGALVQPNAELWVTITGTGTTGTLDIDAIQVEEGQVATAYSLRSNGVPAHSDVRNRLVGHAKLVFEYKGEQLTAAQRDHVLSLYQTYPRAYEDYGKHFAPPSPTISDTEGKTEFCTRLQEPHVTQSVLESFFSNGRSVTLTCVDDMLTSVKNLPLATNDRQALIDGAREASVNLLQKTFSPVVTGSTSQARRLGIQARLWLFGRWYGQVKTGVYVTDGEWTAADKIAKDTSVLAGTLWKSLYKDDVTALAASLKTDADIAAHLSVGMAKDRELLRALLTDFTDPFNQTAPPLTNAPALYFLADGFRTMSDRLGMIAPYHDIGCRFLSCANTGKKSQTTALHEILASLHDPAALLTALSRADSLNASGTAFAPSWSGADGWRDVLGLVQSRHAAVVQSAVRDAITPSPSTYAPALVSDATNASFAPLAELSGMIKVARQRTDHFTDTGLLLRRSASGLPTGLLESKLAQVQNSVVGAQGALTQRVAEYQGTRAQTASSLIQEIQLQQTQIGMDSRLSQAALRLIELSEDDENLKVSGSIDADRFSRQGMRYSELMKTLEDGLGAQLMRDDTTYVAPATFPGQGRYTRNGGPIDGLNEVALVHPVTGHFWKVTGDKGHVVNLSVTGKWAPTCSLQALDGSFQGIPVSAGIAEAQTGPEGYEFTYSGSTFSGREVRKTRSRGWSLGASLLGSVASGGGAGPLAAAAALQATASYSMSGSRSTSSWSGSESRNTAAFQLGIRLPNTPFPEFPAGSLLAVMVPPGSSNPVPAADYDIQVVQAPATSIVFTKAADLFLVVNDAECATFGAGNLTVDTMHLVPAAEKMEQLGTAMEAVHASFREQADAVIAQGRLLPTQTSAMREEAWQGLREACACDLSPYPEAVRGFFGTWIDHEIVHIEREVELMQIGREMEHQMLDVAALRSELATLERQGRYARLLPLWSLRNLTFSNEYVRDATDNLARMVSEELYPFIHLRYQDVLTGSPVVIGLLDSGKEKLERLIDLDWQDDTLDTVAIRVKDATTALSDKLAEVINKDKASCPVENSAGCAVMVSRAVVRFPNPYRRPFYESFLPPPGKAADEARSAAVWDAINSYFTDPATARPIHVGVMYEDLFAAGTSNGSIGCKSASPVIRAMALYVVTSASNADTLNKQEVRVPTRPGRHMQFVGVGDGRVGDGIATFRFDNDDWLVPRDRVLYGEQVDAIGTFLDVRNKDRYAYSEGTSGISPFSSDAFEFAPLGVWGDPNLDATELMLVMELESRTKSGGVKGVSVCKAP